MLALSYFFSWDFHSLYHSYQILQFIAFFVAFYFIFLHISSQFLSIFFPLKNIDFLKNHKNRLFFCHFLDIDICKTRWQFDNPVVCCLSFLYFCTMLHETRSNTHLSSGSGTKKLPKNRSVALNEIIFRRAVIVPDESSVILSSTR
jgi:hypothetical protein